MAEQPKPVGVFDSLPDHLLCQILLFLPIKEAARTSVLSLRWRYLFLSSISILELKGRIRPIKKDDSFFNFVDGFFYNPYPVNLECFRVHDFLAPYDIPPLQLVGNISWMDNDYLRINGWIWAALGRGVKELDIFSVNKQVLALPTLLFTCRSLVTLKLKIKGVKLNGVPTNACLPNLKTLHFSFVEFLDSHSVLKFISSCPVLEDFAFVVCRFHKKSELRFNSLSLKRLVLVVGSPGVDSPHFFNVIDVNAPNLVYFKYVDEIAKRCTLREMKSLETADIKITLRDTEDREHERATNLLQRVCNVQSLYLHIEDYTITPFPVPLDPMLTFNKLFELRFSNYLSGNWHGRWIVEFLHCMPNLKTLVLDLV